MSNTTTIAESQIALQPIVVGAEARDDPLVLGRNGSSGPGNSLASGEEEGRRHESSLPPVDSGKDAYLFLAACFMVEALVWGFPFSFGVFQDYYSEHEPFKGQPNIALVGTCAMVL
ncbi:uncharacterized protein E0L32_004229 [Thyridium curvatum]|uniref:Uncharacterized protein n=1 Tax=Thyridium curvatum TaxID=1093900 RepID=A0A507BEZ7_9PEZI|nr:uncharacterized protein E0L32_004229 [Thyridium curvatum]TPX15531.1 hypothetical protein E0L32_004229 [Thyridium curvatum]